MSLILEALKKSDQERRRERAPDLQSIHRPLPGHRVAPRRGPWLLGSALLVVNLAALGLWWYLQKPPAAALPVPAPAVAEATPAPAVAAPPADPVSAPVTASPVPEPAPVPAPRRPPIRELWELPDPVRHALPAMTFSFHVYSENPERRTIIINERRMREGDQVGEGVLLEEITEDGVILALEDHRVHIPVLSDW